MHVAGGWCDEGARAAQKHAQAAAAGVEKATEATGAGVSAAVLQRAAAEQQALGAKSQSGGAVGRK